jgi:putative flippase GtrA
LNNFYHKSRVAGIHLLLESIKRAPSKDISVQVVRSLVVSVIAFIADFGMLIFFKEALGVNYLLAATLSFGIGVFVNYVLSVRWVFANRKLSNRNKELIIFIIICSVGLVLNSVIIAGMVQVVGMDYRFAKIVSTIIVFFWNFIARKKILY